MCMPIHTCTQGLHTHYKHRRHIGFSYISQKQTHLIDWPDTAASLPHLYLVLLEIMPLWILMCDMWIEFDIYSFKSDPGPRILKHITSHRKCLQSLCSTNGHTFYNVDFECSVYDRFRRIYFLSTSYETLMERRENVSLPQIFLHVYVSMYMLIWGKKHKNSACPYP